MPIAKQTLKRKRSTKGALVKGVSPLLPKVLLSDSTFRTELKGLMRGYSGLYALHKGKRLYYVGLAKDIFWRLHRHTRNKHAKKWDCFAIYRIRNVTFLKDIETLLLRIAKPPGNAVGGKFHSDADMTRVLKKLQRQQSHVADQVKKALREKS